MYSNMVTEQGKRALEAHRKNVKEIVKEIVKVLTDNPVGLSIKELHHSLEHHDPVAVKEALWELLDRNVVSSDISRRFHLAAPGTNNAWV